MALQPSRTNERRMFKLTVQRLLILGLCRDLPLKSECLERSAAHESSQDSESEDLRAPGSVSLNLSADWIMVDHLTHLRIHARTPIDSWSLMVKKPQEQGIQKHCYPRRRSNYPVTRRWSSAPPLRDRGRDGASVWQSLCELRPDRYTALGVH